MPAPRTMTTSALAARLVGRTATRGRQSEPRSLGAVLQLAATGARSLPPPAGVPAVDWRINQCMMLISAVGNERSAARDIQRAEPPQRVLLSLFTEFETSGPADLPAYAVGELIMALLAALQAETRSQMKDLCDGDFEMPRRRAIG